MNRLQIDDLPAEQNLNEQKQQDTGIRALSRGEMQGTMGGRCKFGTPDNGCDPGTPLDPRAHDDVIVDGNIITAENYRS